VRAIMDAGWRAGASDVQCFYRSSVALLAFVEHLADAQRALVVVMGDATPDLYADIDHARLARIVPADAMRRRGEIAGRRGVAWTVVPFPTEAWSARIFGEPDVGRLRHVMARATRLEELDPVAAWRGHLAELSARAHQLQSRAYDPVRVLR